MMIAMTSCYSSQTIKVHGNPGTEIYSAGWSYFGTMPNSGELKIKINDNSYYPFMLSVAQNDDKIIPFGIDYTYKNRPWAGVANGVGMTIATAGLIGTVAGGIGIACDSENETMGILLGSSLGAAELGVAIGMPGDCRGKQAAYKYKYKYLTSQHTNDNLHFTRPDIKYVESEINKNNKSENSEVSNKIEDWYKKQVDFNEIYEITVTNLNTKKKATIQKPEATIVFIGTALDDDLLDNGVRLKYWYKEKLHETDFIKTNQFSKSRKIIKASKQKNKNEYVTFTILSDNELQLVFKDGNLKYDIKFNPKSIYFISDDIIEDVIISEMDDELS